MPRKIAPFKSISTSAQLVGQVVMPRLRLHNAKLYEYARSPKYVFSHINLGLIMKDANYGQHN
jgi:hypothetical protein